MTTLSSATSNRTGAPLGLRREEPPSLSAIIGFRGWTQIGVIGTLLLLVYWGPLRSSVIYRWMYDADWSHGWLVPLFSLYFLYAQREQLRGVRVEPSYVGLGIMAASLGVYFCTMAFLSIGMLRPLCFIGTLFGVTLFVGGWPVMRVAWFPILFLTLAVPIPPHHYVALTMPLRQLACVVAAAMLKLVPDLQVDISGVVIDYLYHGRSGSLNVEAACAGMRLTMAFVTLGVAMAYLVPRPWWQRAVMVLMCVPIAVFCNMIRVTITGLLYVMKDTPWGQSWGLENLTRGTPHALLGLAMLPLALGLYMLLGWVLANVMVEVPEEVRKGGGVEAA